MSSRRRKFQQFWQRDTLLSEERSNDPSSETYTQLKQEIWDLGVEELLEADPRPTFVLNFNPNNEYPFQPVFLNASLRSDTQLLREIGVDSKADVLPLARNSVYSAFQQWISQIPGGNASSNFSGFDTTWTGYSVKQLVFVAGHRNGIVQNSHEPDLPASPTSPGSSGQPHDQPPRSRWALRSTEDVESLLGSHLNTSVTSFVTTGTPDWTVEDPEGDLSPHIQWVRSIDWSSTPLGAMSSWTPEFRQIACLLMANPHSAAIFWGDDLTVLYNQAYAEREAGTKHPELMGTGLRGPFEEIWHLLSPIFSECQRTGKGFSVNDQMLPLARRGFVEETYYTWSLTPLYGGTQNLLGFYNAPFETTKQIRNARALKTLFKLGQEMTLAKSVSEFWPKILSVLSDNGLDFPFAVVYSIADNKELPPVCSETCQSLDSCITEGDSPRSNSYLSLRCCKLEGTIGVPDGHPAAPGCVDLNRSMNGYVTAFRDAMHSGEPKLLSIKDGNLPSSLMEDIHWRGFGEPCREVVVCPIRPVHSTTGESVLGFLVFGVNPRREFDEDYQSFIQLLDRQLATSLASVTLIETELRRSENAAAAATLERYRLTEELAVERSRLQRIAEVSQVGMFSIDPDGLLLEANPRWFEMTGHSRNVIYSMSWMETIHENSISVVKEAWTRLTVAQISWVGELQLKKGSLDAATDDEAGRGTWIIAACQPEFAEGQLKSIMGSITDISSKKWAEAVQSRRLQEAEEIRRAQNNFIDITSHEMRNPLSAILHCADGISSSLDEVLQNQELSLKSQLAIRECMANAETVQLCAQHQKSIVDDILTISKLDSNLLLITPVAVQPVEIVRQALQMFVGECEKTHQIKLELHIDQSINDLDISMVMLDSSRLLQVLINLLTNAIKFTKSSRIRAIDVTVSAYLNPPTPQAPDFQYFPSPAMNGRSDFTSAPEWGSGRIIYLRFEVKDSGCGMNSQEKKRLFNRFSQASPRTHVQYGGSGLGLFISRQLTELQGGEIGVASEKGQGSTFACYIKARRAENLPGKVGGLQQSAGREVPPTAMVNTDTHKPLLEQEELQSPVAAMTVNPECNMSRWHILIVEDNLVNQRILAQQIRRLGATVYVANHGGEALSIIQQTKHFKGRETDGNELSVILMDLEMPVMDGLTCVRRIREMEAEGLIHGRIPIIAVTANARDEQIVLAKSSGMDDVMPKPFRIIQIRTKIEAALLKQRL